jgi:hypothetical protein
MASPYAEFAAFLPNLAVPVQIGTFDDAKVFTRRWAIRDKDPDLKALLRRMERANSLEAIASVLREFKQALKARGLLPAPAVN